jgi:hypothetical protein
MESAPLLGYQTSVFRAQPPEGTQRKIQKRNRPPVSCLLCRTRKVTIHLTFSFALLFSYRVIA